MTTLSKDEIKVLIAANANQVVNSLQAAAQGRAILTAVDLLPLLTRATEFTNALALIEAKESQEREAAAKTAELSAKDIAESSEQ